MELRRCSFHHLRSQLVAHIEKGNHIFDIPRSQDKLFPKKICHDNKIITQDQVQHSIMRALAIVSSSLNISSQKATSKKMEDFIHFLLKLGIQLKKNFPNQSLVPDDLFTMSNTNKMADYIKLAGEESFKNAIFMFKGKYINLQMDSGTVSKLKVIHYVISIPEDRKIKPFLFDLIENKNFDSIQYGTFTNSVVSDIFDNNIILTSIIVDNLRCQTKGLELMKCTSDNPLTKGIYILYCFCHLISLVFVNTLNNNSHLSKIVDSIKKIVTILRKSSSKAFIGKTCPSIVQIRWLYLFEVLVFFDNFKNDIITILKSLNEEELEKQLPEILELLLIIKPMRYFCDMMEKSYSISCVSQYAQDMINYFRKQTFLLINDIFEDIYTNFIARFLTNNFDLVICSYILSPGGRNAFRKKYKASVTTYDEKGGYYKYRLHDIVHDYIDHQGRGCHPKFGTKDILFLLLFYLRRYPR